MNDSREPTVPGPDDQLSFTVATVWREERVSCPHADILKAWLAGSLDPDAAAFVEFHLDESQCPYCNAVLEDLRLSEKEVHDSGFEDLRDRLMRSTVAALKRASGG